MDFETKWWIINNLKEIKRVMTWWPNKIFYETKVEYHKYEKPDISFFGTSYGRHEVYKEFTKLGEYFHNWPLLEILKLPYYLITLPIMMISNFLWLTFEIFFLPRSISKEL